MCFCAFLAAYVAGSSRADAAVRSERVSKKIELRFPFLRECAFLQHFENKGNHRLELIASLDWGRFERVAYFIRRLGSY